MEDFEQSLWCTKEHSSALLEYRNLIIRMFMIYRDIVIFEINSYRHHFLDIAQLYLSHSTLLAVLFALVVTSNAVYTTIKCYTNVAKDIFRV